MVNLVLCRTLSVGCRGCPEGSVGFTSMNSQPHGDSCNWAPFPQRTSTDSSSYMTIRLTPAVVSIVKTCEPDQPLLRCEDALKLKTRRRVGRRHQAETFVIGALTERERARPEVPLLAVNSHLITHCITLHIYNRSAK